MKKNLKISILAVFVMLFMAVAVSVLTFSFADEGDPGSGSPQVNTPASGDAKKTMIDYIIENSNLTATVSTGSGVTSGSAVDTDSTVDPVYKIVEIGSGAISSSSFETFSSGAANAFATYVLDGNRS